ncbi:MAG: mechanosensitive ion channel family protein [Bdellovibrionales bacterium]
MDMNASLQKMLDTTLYGNTALDWGIALGISTLVLVGLWILKVVCLRRLSDFSAHANLISGRILLEALRRTQPLFLFLLALWMGAQHLDLAKKMERLIDNAVLVVFLVQGGLWAVMLTDGWMKSYRERRLTSNPDAVTSFSAVTIIFKLAVWIFVTLLVLQNFGINVTALVTGLGIGGVAVALAAQNILGDLFASISIAVDRPFVVGDFLALGEHMGTVEYIGMKSTRLRSLSGEQIVMANTNLLGSRIRNYGRMYERRVAVTISVTYQTPRAKLAEIPAMLRSIIEAQSDARFDRAHFKSFGESGLEFEYVYFVRSSDYGIYMDINERINLALLERFENDGIGLSHSKQPASA